MNTYLYVHPGLRSVSLFQDAALPAMTERHHFRLPVLSLKETGDLAGEIDAASAAGVVFGVEKGLPDRNQLRLAGHALRRGRAVYFYWPLENATEVVDEERLSSFWRHWAAYVAVNRALAVRNRLRGVRSRLSGAKQRLLGTGSGSHQASFEAALNGLRATSASTYQELSSELNADVVKLAGARSRLLSLTAGLRAAEARLDQIEDDAGAAEHVAAVRKILRDLQAHADDGEATVAQASVSLYGLSQRVRSASADSGLGASGQHAAAIKQYQDAL